jgi:hypothetical protein
MKSFLSVLLLLCVATSALGQDRETLLYKPCFNDSISAFSGMKLDKDFILCVHDLVSSDSLPSKLTRSKLVLAYDSCQIEEAILYHRDKQAYLNLNVASNNGPASISDDGKLLFLSNTYSGVSEDQMGIFVLNKTSNGWAIQNEFPFNSSDYSVMHPTYDEENKRMFFTSNKDRDNFNLYYIDFDGEAFGDSMYAMNDINAIDANDVFPYFHNGVLHFSSDRENYTFLNFYEAELLGGEWDIRPTPDPLFKSGYDDFSLNMVSDRTGFFATTRNTNGKKDELMIFRKRIDCSELPNFSSEKFLDDSNGKLDEALKVIEEFRNVFGTESELTYQLNVDYIKEQFENESMNVADFYCNLFNYIDSASLVGIDATLEKSLETEKLVDSLFAAVSNDMKQEIIVDSLITTIEERYKEIGVQLEMEELRAALKEAYEPLKSLSDSLVHFSDTLKKALEEALVGFVIEDEKLPDFAMKPNGLFFAIQVGAYKEKTGPQMFANLNEVIEVDGPTGLHHYITGYCNSVDAALKAQAQVRGVGYLDAFIVAYCDGKRIPLFRAKELISSGECEPITESRELNIDYTVLVNRPGTDKPFTVKVDPNYNKATGAVEAVASETREGLFFTVQIGVFDGPVSASKIKDMPDLITTLLSNGQIRYSSGRYNSEEKANAAISQVVQNGITDAFVTAYYKGKRIPVSKTQSLLREEGKGILEKFD